MTIDDAPMHELDLAIRREAAALRSDIEASAHTDEAWSDFVGTRTAPIVRLEGAGGTGRHRWRIALAIGAAAALVTALWIVGQTRDGSPVQPPVSPSTTAPSDSSATTYEVVVLRGNSALVSIGSEGRGRLFNTLPPEPKDGFVHADVSSNGWVAETSVSSKGFWFFDLRDPVGTRRFVDIAGPLNGATQTGRWNPQGTLYATIEASTTAVVVDPVTGIVTRLPSTNPPVGDAPTWTADGSGLLTGTPAPTCVSADRPVERIFSVVAIDGRPEVTEIPQLAFGTGHVTGGGVWSNDNSCGQMTASGVQPALSDIVVVGQTGTSQWIRATDLPTAKLLTSAFDASGEDLWVLARDTDPYQRVRMYRVTAPGVYEGVNALPPNVDGQSTISIAAVAPDDSSVVVLAVRADGQRDFYLLPTDGSRANDLGGEFAGHVSTAVIEELP